MFNYYTDVLKKYAVFSGRASRAEYWYFALCNVIIAIVLSIVDSYMKSGILYSLYMLAILVPGLAVTIRRLHDIGKSGWWFFIELVPIIGGIWLLILLIRAGEAGDNKYGPNPKGVSAPVQQPQQPQQPQQTV